MRRTYGFTLVEVLIALVIFSAVTGLAAVGIVQAVQLQAVNEANTSLQAKLRRISEVVGQDLRSTMFGGITNSPYVSGDGAVSFTLADRGQGYAVFASGGASFPNSANIDIYAVAPSAAALGLIGSETMMVNGAGAAIVFPITNVVGVGPVARQRWNVVHAGCNNTIAYVDPVRLFTVDSVGYRFDPVTGNLFRRLSGGTERVVAFGLSDVEFAYVYDADDGTTVVRTAPFVDAGVPLRVTQVGGVNHVLAAVRVTVEAQEQLNGRVIERSYVAQVRMPDAGSVNLRSVVTCP